MRPTRNSIRRGTLLLWRDDFGTYVGVILWETWVLARVLWVGGENDGVNEVARETLFSEFCEVLVE